MVGLPRGGYDSGDGIVRMLDSEWNTGAVHGFVHRAGPRLARPALLSRSDAIPS